VSDTLLVSRDGGVLRVTLNRPDKKNALTGAMYRALTAAFEDAAQEPGIGAILVEGAGGNFTAGNDIADFSALAQSLGAFPALDFIRALARCDMPLVAAVDGVAIGIGTTMLFHCDLVYAAPAARFRMPFVDLGLVPEAGASLLVPQRVGLQKAAEWLLLGEAFGAEEACRIGLVNGIVASGELAEHALSRAHALAAKPRAALAATRRLIRGDRSGLLDRIEEEARAFGIAMRSVEARAAFAAFLGKTKKS
jgi:enoyl-CoA hydratase/carnithine racemase